MVLIYAMYRFDALSLLHFWGNLEFTSYIVVIYSYLVLCSVHVRGT